MADIEVTNTDADLSGNTLVTEENAYTITGLHTFSRSTNAPFAVVSGAALVANLDADKLDGQTGSYYIDPANLSSAVGVSKGGTGATSLTDGGVLLGNGTSAVTVMAVLADGEMIVGDGTTDPVAESGATLRTSIGVGTGDSPQFTAINLGHASDTTLTRASSGNVSIEGNAIYRAGGTDVPVTDGGTGVSSLTDGGVLLGSGSSAITPMAVLADSEMIVGDGSGDPVAESGATLRTSVGVGTGDSPQFTGIELGHASDTTLTRASAGNVSIEGNAIYRAGGTDVPVTDGGTGVSSLTDGGVLLGSGSGAITPMSVLADSEMIVGDGSGDPVAESGATLRTSIGVGTGDSPQFTGLTVSGTGASSLDVGGGINVGTGNVALVGTDGKMNGPLRSAIIDDLSAANMTAVPAGELAGTIANARLPTNVDLGGTLDVTGATTLDSTLTTAGRTLCGTGVTTSDGILAAATTSNHVAIFESVRDDDNGCTINIRQASASPGDNDQPGRIHVYARDDGATFRNTHRVDFNFDDVSAGTTDSSFKFGTMNNSSSGTNATASLTAAGVWTDASDEDAKEYLGTIQEHIGGSVLDQLTNLNTGVYTQKDLPPGKAGETHAGPTAQEWYTLFSLGRDPEVFDPGIGAKDLASVALAAVQELVSENQTLASRIAALEAAANAS